MCNICGDKAHNNGLDDSLDDLFGENSASFPVGSHEDLTWHPQTKPEMTEAEFAADALKNATFDPDREATFEEPCKKCRGRGRFISYAGRDCGPCFTCKGSGKQVFKTSAEARQKAADDKARRHQAKIDQWIAEHPAEFAWMAAAHARGFRFASDMLDGLKKYASLFDSKVEKIREFMEKDRLREVERAAIAAKAPTIEASALVKITDAFAKALEAQLKAPKMRLDQFIFSAVTTGKNAGSIYVKLIEKDDNGERQYLGRITEGRFHRSFQCSPDQEAAIIAAATDPEAAAKAYGQRTGTCSICGRELTRAESIDRAMGPICAERFGW